MKEIIVYGKLWDKKAKKNDKGKPEEEGAGGMRARKQWRIRCDNSGLMGK